VEELDFASFSVVRELFATELDGIEVISSFDNANGSFACFMV
jgi:hypothetical protein